MRELHTVRPAPLLPAFEPQELGWFLTSGPQPYPDTMLAPVDQAPACVELDEDLLETEEIQREAAPSPAWPRFVPVLAVTAFAVLSAAAVVLAGVAVFLVQ